MGRRKNDDILSVLVELPWWVSVLVSGFAYLFLSTIFPAIASDRVALAGVAQGAPELALLFALVLLLPAPISYLNSRRKRRLLDSQTDIASIRSLGWRQFEELLGEAYRRRGYIVTENPGAGADGGVDIRLHKNGRTHLMQCKQWKSQKVGVSVVREMYGILSEERADSTIIVTSGGFTQEARDFARDLPVELIDGYQLSEMIGAVVVPLPKRPANSAVPTQKQERDASDCPACGAPLIVRTARRGTNAGKAFLGCSTFPTCRYTRN
jgi:restriction system protein